MINTEFPDRDPIAHDAKVEEIVERGPAGALIVSGIATGVVVTLWLLFYLLVFVPRGGTP